MIYLTVPIDAQASPRCKLGYHRIFNLIKRADQTFAWEDKFKRLLLRFERIQQRYYGLLLLAYTLIKPREFWGA